jgi:hypothetical protein
MNEAKLDQTGKVVAEVTFNSDGPTTIPLKELYTWVVWQFPRRKKGGYCGAVRPTIAGHAWFPALIQPDRQRIHVYAHLTEQFITPEAAAKHLEGLLVTSGE